MKRSWLKALCIQSAVMAAACLAAEISYYASSMLHSICLWAAVPLLGAYTAMKCVLAGLNNYAAWIAPPACCVLAALILWGYVPGAGPVLVCAFVSLVGAAAGEVKSKENNRR